jgi:site-specific recombinase XerC
MIALEPGVRNRTLLRTLYASGVRVSEASGLKWRDLQSRTSPMMQTSSIVEVAGSAVADVAYDADLFDRFLHPLLTALG